MRARRDTSHPRHSNLYQKLSGGRGWPPSGVRTEINGTAVRQHPGRLRCGIFHQTFKE